MVETAREQESTLTTSAVEQPEFSRAHIQPANSGASSEEQPQPPVPNNGVEEPGLSGTTNVEGPGPSRASSVKRPGPSRASSVEAPGPSRVSNVEGPGPSRASSVKRPGPSRANSVEQLASAGPSSKKRKMTKIEKIEKSSRKLSDKFCAAQEKTMRG